MTVVFLCGAGASRFGGLSAPDRPPLGQRGELFRALRDLGGVWATLSPTMAAAFEDHFETGMDLFMREREPDITAALREMAFYFLEFKPDRSHHYFRLIRECYGAGAKPVFATTNYEMLLEWAVEESGYPVGIGEEPPLVGAIDVLKLHGSSNFVVRPPPGLVMKGCSVRDTREYFRGMHVTAEWPAAARRLLTEYPEFAPSMSLYARDKRVLFSGEIVEQAQRRFRSVLPVALRTYVIGLSVNPIADSHIWQPLASGDGWLGYVGKEPDDFLEWADGERRRNAHVVAETFDDAMTLIPGQLRQRPQLKPDDRPESTQMLSSPTDDSCIADRGGAR